MTFQALKYNQTTYLANLLILETMKIFMLHKFKKRFCFLCIKRYVCVDSEEGLHNIFDRGVTRSVEYPLKYNETIVSRCEQSDGLYNYCIRVMVLFQRS